MDIAWKNFSKGLSLDAKLAIWLGAMEGFLPVQKFWLNPSVGTSFETIWDLGGDYNWIGTASILNIVSTDPNDANGDTGANKIQIYGLNENYESVNEEIILNGTTIVPTTKTYKRIHRMVVLSAGASEGAEGTITAQIGATVHAQIVNGNNQTLMGVYTIPAGYTGLLIKGKASCGKGKEVHVNFKARPLGGVFNLAHSFYVYQNNYEYEFWLPVRLEEKTDITVEALSDIATEVSAVFDIVLIKN